MRVTLPALAVLLLGLGATRADPPVASYIFPAGGQRGKKVSVRVGGLFLHDRCGWEVSGLGVKASPELRSIQTRWFEGPLLPLPESQRAEDYPRDMAGEIDLAADAPLGRRSWRLWTAQGATPSKTFVVGELPEVVENEMAGPPVPVAVTLPVTINGRIFPREDVDLWSFQADRGQTITAMVQAETLGSPLDAHLAILGPEQRVLAENDDHQGADPLLRFTAPQAGTYQVRIRDVRYQGSQAHVYRLTLTAGVVVDRVYPLGGRRGTTTAFTLSGQGVPTDRVTVSLPKAPVGAYPHRFALKEGHSNPVWLALDDLPEYLAEDIKPSATGSRDVALPCVVNGRIERAGATQTWTFQGHKGEMIAGTLWAQQLGSPLRGVLTLSDASGKVLQRVEAAAKGSGDPVLRHTLPAEGRYTLQVADRFRSRGGPAHAYRLRLAREEPDVALTLLTDALTVPRGGQATLKVQIDWQGGVKEPLALTVRGLPAEIHVPPVTVPANKNVAELIFKADASARIRPALVTVEGTTTRSAQKVTRRATLAGKAPEDNSLLLAVSLPTPFKVVGAYETGNSPRGSVQVRKYRIERGGYNGPLTIRLTDRQARHLQGVTGPMITVPPGVNEFEYPFTLPPWMEIGRTCRVCVMAVGVIHDPDGSKHAVSYSSTAQNDQYITVVETGQLDLTLGKDSIALSRGQVVSIPVQIARAQGVRGAVRIEALIPEYSKGLEVAPVVIPTDRDQGILSMKFTREATGPLPASLLIRATLMDGKRPLVAEARLELAEE